MIGNEKIRKKRMKRERERGKKGGEKKKREEGQKQEFRNGAGRQDMSISGRELVRNS